MSDVHSCSYYCERPECIKAQRDEFRSRLEQQEPVAWWDGSYANPFFRQKKDSPGIGVNGIPLYAIPPQREWQGLTEDEVAQAMYRADAIITGPMQFKFAKEIEAKLEEKNT